MPNSAVLYGRAARKNETPEQRTASARRAAIARWGRTDGASPETRAEDKRRRMHLALDHLLEVLDARAIGVMLDRSSDIDTIRELADLLRSAEREKFNARKQKAR